MTPPPCHIYSSSEYYILQIKDIQALCVRDGTHQAQSCTRQSFSQKTISHCCSWIRWLIPKLAQSKDQGRLNVCDETNNCYQINCASARMFIFWWYCAREWFYQGGRYKTLALNLDNLWIAIVKLGADMRQAGNQNNIFSFLFFSLICVREGVKKNRLFLGKSPKQRTPPTHRYSLGLT